MNKRLTLLALITLVAATALLSGCSLKSPPFDEWAAFRAEAAAYPETRSNAVQVTDVQMDPPHAVPHRHGPLLPAFARSATVAPNARAELDGFSILYQAPNRHPQAAEPYLPASIADRVMIVRGQKPVVDQELLAGFTGADSDRRIEAARLQIGERPFLLLVSHAAPGNPVWIGIYGARGEVMYRGALPSGIVHFTENKHGVTFVDDAGFGKRVVLL